MTLLFCACAPVKLTQSFDPKEAAYAIKPGSGTIEGQAFVRKTNGRPVTAAGLEVNLFPVTPLTKEMMAAVEAGSRLQAIPPELGDYVRVTKADINGRFKFEKVGAGEYYVFTRVEWTEGRGDDKTLYGKRIFEHVKIGPGERKSVTVGGAVTGL